MEAEVGRDRLLDKRVQKQIGCVTGFFKIFGRQHVLNANRLDRAPVVDYSSEQDKSFHSTSVSMAVDDLTVKSSCLSPLSIRSEATTPVKTPPSAMVYEFKDMSRSTWKLRESPRLSLDSRATVYKTNLATKNEETEDGLETQRKSTSVIAKLMGLETLPDLNSELRRSASESRVCKNLFPSLLIEGADSWQKKSGVSITDSAKSSNCNALDNVVTKMMVPEQNRKPQHWKRSPYESADVYPEETRLSSHGEVERRLKSRGVNIDEPLMELDSLKLVLEALQLKGLLRKTEQVSTRLRRPQNESPPRSSPRLRPQPPPRGNATLKSPITARKGEERNSRSPRKVKPMAKTGKKLEVSELSSMSESAVSDAESTKAELKDKRSVLERCDSLLQSIAEFNNKTKMHYHQLEGQPSPVSVLDSPLYNDDSSSTPSPVMKPKTKPFHHISYTKLCVLNRTMCPAVFENEPCIDDPDFIFISDILRFRESFLNDSEILRMVKEQQRTKTSNTDSSGISKLQSKLVFDIATELIKKHTYLPEWKPASFSNSPPLTLIWSEFQNLRDDKPNQEDMIELVRNLLRKDLSTDSLSAHHMETKETVVDVERMIFRDLIEDAIRDLGWKSALASSQPPLRKKLLF